MKISAALVRQLREHTGAGVMDCKRALERATGDMDQAREELRLSGIAKADGKAHRVASQGLVRAAVTERGDAGVLLEVNCETDFVAREESFQRFVENLCHCVLRHRPATKEKLLALPLMEGAAAVEEERRLLVMKLGENITLRRFHLVENARGRTTSYLHGGGRIGVLVELEGGDEQCARELAMQIAWGKPRFLCRDDLPEAVLQQALAAAEDKKQEEVVADLVLMEQPFIKDQELSVGRWLRERHAEVRCMARFEVGSVVEPLDARPHAG